jgi:hypothetical protein
VRETLSPQGSPQPLMLGRARLLLQTPGCCNVGGIMNHRVCLALALCFVALAGCKSSAKIDPEPVAVTGSGAKTNIELKVQKPTVAAGEVIQVSYGRALTAPPGQQYWITLTAFGAPDPTWGDWHYVKQGATADEIVTKTAGEFEVRLHDIYPEHPTGVIARLRVTVVAK